MPRVLGVDPGTVSVDVCGLDDGTLWLDRSIPTTEALADPDAFVALLASAGPLDLIAGPSGYGLPLIPAAAATEEDLRVAFLAGEVTKAMLFRGGAQSAAEADPSRQTLALDAFVEGALKAVRSLLVSVPAPREI